MESIRKFADEFHASGKKLHLLLNCHGFKPCNSSTQLSLSADNFEHTMAANHLGQYSLFHLTSFIPHSTERYLCVLNYLYQGGCFTTFFFLLVTDFIFVNE